MSSVVDQNNESLVRRLQFPDDRLYGRDDELDHLFKVYRRFYDGALNDVDHNDEQSTSMAQMVLISGYSGTGKSSLVYQFRDYLQQTFNSTTCSNDGSHANDFLRRARFIWISGVYEDRKTDPFSAVAAAFSSYCVQLIEENDAEEIHRVATGIKKAVGNEGKVLTDVIPGLTRLIGDQPEASMIANNENSLNRLLFLFQSFVEVICRNRRPLILFLDDLQRADAASLDLITALMTTDTAFLGKNLLFIGALRSNEVEQDHPLSVALDTIRTKRRQNAIQEVQLSNLSREVVNQFISKTLDLDWSETMSLTNALYNKTQGNIFFTKQSLEQLNENQVLKYDVVHSSRWIWNTDRIGRELALSDNVVDIITARIVKLPMRLQKALSAAAFLRSSFDLWTIEGFMETSFMQVGQLEDSCCHDYDLVELLDMAVGEGLLENEIGSTTYKYTHDRVQQAAYSLVPVGQVRDEMQLRLGEYLLERASSDSGEDWMWFVAADLLNATKAEVPGLAKLNLTVGEKANALSAFIAASAYFRKGLEALAELSSSPWQSDYCIALRLHRSASSNELSVGDFDEGWRLAHIILDNARSVSDKMETYMSLADALGRRERAVEAIGVMKQALEHLGECPHPSRLPKVQILKEAQAMKKAFRQLTDADILQLPMMVDTSKLRAMEFLTHVAQRAFKCGDRVTAILSIFRQLQLSLRHGLSGHFAFALSGYGLMLCGNFKDDEGGQRMGRLSKDVLRLTKEEGKINSGTLRCVGVFIDAWFVPLTSVMETSYQAHISGMKTGAFETGFHSYFDFNVISYAAGTSLGQIERDGARMRRLMEQYSVREVISIFKEFQVLIFHLTGTEMDNDWRAPPLARKSPVTSLADAWYSLTRMQLSYFFDEMTLADEMSAQVLALVKRRIRSYVFVSHTLFFASLIATSMAMQTRKRKYLVRAKQLRKEMNRLARTKGMNLLHKYLIVEAQYNAMSTCRKRCEKIRAKFDEAISVSARSGFTQDAAIANELAGEYFLRVKDKFWARHYLTNAHQKYHDWGAYGKVHQLLRKHQRLIDTSVCLQSKSFTRKHTIRGEACDQHRKLNIESLSGCTVESSLREYG